MQLLRIARPMEKDYEVVYLCTHPKCQTMVEGHSNSLTEAMACGVVPVVSNVGFNASVCGTKELVVNEIRAELFADRIIEIERSGRWKYYSERMIERVRDNYTESIVGKMLIGKINELF